MTSAEPNDDWRESPRDVRSVANGAGAGAAPNTSAGLDGPAQRRARPWLDG